MPEFSGPAIGTVERYIWGRGSIECALDAHRLNPKMDDREVTDWLIEVTGRQALHSRQQQKILLGEMGKLKAGFGERILAYLLEKEALMRRLSERVREFSSGGVTTTSGSRLSSKMTTNRPLLLGGGEAIVLRLLQSLHVNGGQK